MSDDRVSETTIREPAHDTHTTTVIERRSGSGGLLIGLALLILAIVVAVFLFNRSANDNARTDAVTAAAKSVSDGAKQVGSSAEKAADSVTKQ